MVSKSDLNPDETSLEISVRNRLGNPWQKPTVLILTRIDDYLYHESKSRVEKKKTDSDGTATFNQILEGKHHLKCITKGARIEKIIETRQEKVEMELPLILGWLPKISDRFKKKELISENELEEEYEKARTDQKFCFSCKREYEDWREKYECQYCEKLFCSDHRIPENHECWGNPTSPPFRGMRVKIKDEDITVSGV